MKKTAFKNMTTKVELVRRIERTEGGVNILSVGGQIKHVLPFLSSKPMLEQGYQVIEVEVEFANKLTGVDYATKYINIKDNLLDGEVSIDDAHIIRELRCYGEDQKQEEFNNELAKLLVSAFDEINNPDIKHTTFDESTTDEELCNTLGIDVEEFKERKEPEYKDSYIGGNTRFFEKVSIDVKIHNGPFGFERLSQIESGILGVNNTTDSNESTGVSISSDSFINEPKSIDSNNDAIHLQKSFTPEGFINFKGFMENLDNEYKVQVKRKTEKELIHDLNDKFVRDLMDISITFDNEEIDFNEYSDMFSKAVKKYNDTKESPEHKKELMRAKMYEKFFSRSENLR